MAIQNAQARLYNAFHARVVDKSGSATLVSQFTIGHLTQINPPDLSSIDPDVKPSKISRSRFNLLTSTSSLAAQGRYFRKGGVVNATSRSSLIASFPTFIRIDIDALELPEGRDVTLQLEEGFVIEETNRFPFSLGNPNAANNNYVTFRVPKKLNSFPIALFTANFVPLRIKQLAANTNSQSTLSALPIYNPGRLAALFGGNFITLTNAVKTVSSGTGLIDGIFTLNSNMGFLLEYDAETFESFTNFNLNSANSKIINVIFQRGSIFSLNNISNVQRNILNQQFLAQTALLSDNIRIRFSQETLGLSSINILDSSPVKIVQPSVDLQSQTSIFGDLTYKGYELWGSANSSFFTTGQTFKQFGTENNWSKTFLSNSYGLAFRNRNELWAWGSNGNGQLGLGDTSARNVPTRVGSATDWADVKAGPGGPVTGTPIGGVFCLGLKTNGQLFSWGANNDGRTGQNTTTGLTTTPTLVGSASNWTEISAGGTHGLAINSLGQLFSWGLNISGQLGLGDFGGGTSRLVPTRVGTDTDWLKVFAGIETSFAIKSNGTLWVWGKNFNGLLGNGSTTPEFISSPAQIGSATDWAELSVSTNGVLAIKSNGQMWAWGANDQGQLGLGDTTQRTLPTRVGTDSDWVSVKGLNRIIALKSNGTIWAWGNNFEANPELPQPIQPGGPDFVLTPFQIDPGTDWDAIDFGFSGGFAALKL